MGHWVRADEAHFGVIVIAGRAVRRRGSCLVDGPLLAVRPGVVRRMCPRRKCRDVLSGRVLD